MICPLNLLRCVVVMVYCAPCAQQQLLNFKWFDRYSTWCTLSTLCVTHAQPMQIVLTGFQTEPVVHIAGYGAANDALYVIVPIACVFCCAISNCVSKRCRISCCVRVDRYAGDQCVHRINCIVR